MNKIFLLSIFILFTIVISSVVLSSVAFAGTSEYWVPCQSSCSSYLNCGNCCDQCCTYGYQYRPGYYCCSGGWQTSPCPTPPPVCKNECSPFGSYVYQCSGNWLQRTYCGSYDANCPNNLQIYDSRWPGGGWGNYQNCDASDGCVGTTYRDYYCSASGPSGNCYYNDYTCDPRCGTCINPYDAQFISQSVPTTMITGRQYSVDVTMKNTGGNTWTQADSYRLGSQNPLDNWYWGFGRVELSGADAIATGQQKTFSFTVTAPSTPGNYNFQWQMLREYITWFGEASQNVVVNVIPPCTSLTSSQCNSRSDCAWLTVNTNPAGYDNPRTSGCYDKNSWATAEADNVPGYYVYQWCWQGGFNGCGPPLYANNGRSVYMDSPYTMTAYYAVNPIQCSSSQCSIGNNCYNSGVDYPTNGCVFCNSGTWSNKQCGVAYSSGICNGNGGLYSTYGAQSNCPELNCNVPSPACGNTAGGITRTCQDTCGRTGVYKSSDTGVCHSSSCMQTAATFQLTGGYSSVNYPSGSYYAGQTVTITVNSVTASSGWTPMTECRITRSDGTNIDNDAWGTGTKTFSYTIQSSDSLGTWTIPYCGVYTDYFANEGWVLKSETTGASFTVVSPPPAPCSGPSSQSCTYCSVNNVCTGTQTRTCTNGVWSGWSACSGGSCSSCPTTQCPADYCSGTTYYDYPLTCQQTCSSGACQSCACTPTTTICDTRCGGCDTTPPVRSNGQPTGIISTSSTTLSLATNEVATCKYSTAPGTSYDSMPNTFSAIGGTTHSQSLSGLADGAKNYYVRCVDSAGNKNTDDYAIIFTVDATPPSLSIAYSPSSISVVDPVTLTATASDATSGLSSVMISVDGQLKKTCNYNGETSQQNCIYVNPAFGSQGAGVHTFLSTATDRAGLTRTQSTQFNVEACNFGPVSITPLCSGGYSANCEPGEKVRVTATYSGKCPSTAYIQVDASSADNGCKIIDQGRSQCTTDPNKITGINVQCTGGTCSGDWTIPSIDTFPDSCKGKTATATGATIRDNYPCDGGQSYNGATPTGSITFWSESECNNPGVCDYPFEKQSNCPNDCKTTVSISPYYIYPSLQVMLTIDFSDSRYNSGHDVSFEIKIDPGNANEITWNSANGCFSGERFSISASGGNVTQNGRAKIITSCKIPASITPGTHTLQATPTFYSEPTKLIPAETKFSFGGESSNQDFLETIFGYIARFLAGN